MCHTEQSAVNLPHVTVIYEVFETCNLAGKQVLERKDFFYLCQHCQVSTTPKDAPESLTI